MTNNHKHSPWRKSMLIPIWCIQIFFMLVFIALLGLALGLLVNYENDNNMDWDNTQFDNVSDPERVVNVAKDIVVPVWMTLCVVCLVLTITEIILLAQHKLRPLAFLIMNVVKSGIWTVIFILDIVSTVDAAGRTTSVLGIIIDTILALSFWIPLIYGSVIYHRFRHEKKSYKSVDNPSNPFSTSYESHFPKTYAIPSVPGDLESNTVIRDIGNISSVSGVKERSVSFNHERDTRYDAYRKSGFSPEQSVIESFETRGLISGGEIPQVFVEHHDGSYEMESRRELR